MQLLQGKQLLPSQKTCCGAVLDLWVNGACVCQRGLHELRGFGFVL